jgi:hypothetical protein
MATKAEAQSTTLTSAATATTVSTPAVAGRSAMLTGPVVP